MFNTLNKVFKLINISKNTLFFYFYFNDFKFLLELITLGSLIPLISYVNPDLIFNFAKK